MVLLPGCIDSFEVSLLKKVNLGPLILGSVGMLVIIFDGKTAVSGVLAGLELCLHTLIPSLFPFFVLSSLVTGSLIGRSIGPFRSVCRFCGMPAGSESLLVVGLLGGYPVGAGNIAAELKRGTLTAEDAQRMAVFCNNAGPSFLFGILGPLFPHIGWVWLLWAIQIAASVLTGYLLPGGSSNAVVSHHFQSVSLSDSLNRGIKNMTQVCGWVTLFRMILEFLSRFIFRQIPQGLQIILTGLLELSNGCLALSGISDDALRFFLAGTMLSLGGMCVWMQTKAVFTELKIPRYIMGRMLHFLLCTLLSLPAAAVLSDNPSAFVLPSILFVGCSTISLLLILRKQKKEVAFYSSMMYNG